MALKDSIESITISSGDQSVTMSSKEFDQVADKIIKGGRVRKGEIERVRDAEVARLKAAKEAKPPLPGLGHNSDDDGTQDVAGIAGKRLKSFIERVERLEEEKAALAEDIKEVFAEAKGTGFDVKTIRKLIRLRKMDVEKRREEDELLELYKAAIGLE